MKDKRDIDQRYDDELIATQEDEKRKIWKGFHARDGWYFRRLSDGSVRINVVRRDDDGRSFVHESSTLPDNEWASVVASCSLRGDTAENFGEFLRFHNAPNPDSRDGEER